MPCSFSSREAISHDHQSHAQTSWIRRSSPPFRGIGRAHPWIYHRTGGRVGCKLRLGAGFRKPVPTLLLNTGAASPARTSSHHCFTSPTVTMSSSLPLPLGRQKPAVVSQPAAQSRHPHSDRIRSPPGESRRGQLGRAGAPMAAPSRRLRRLRFLPKLDRAWDSGDHLAATLIGVGLLRVVERSRCGYPLRVLSAPRSARPPRSRHRIQRPNQVAGPGNSTGVVTVAAMTGGRKTFGQATLNVRFR